MELFTGSSLFLLILVAIQSGDGVVLGGGGGGGRLSILEGLPKVISSRDGVLGASFCDTFLELPMDGIRIRAAGQWSPFTAPVFRLVWAAAPGGDGWGLRDLGINFGLDPHGGGCGSSQISGVVVAGRLIRLHRVVVIDLSLSVVGIRRTRIWDPGGLCKWIRIWDPGGSGAWAASHYCWTVAQLLTWFGAPMRYWYWIQDPSLWYLFVKDRLPTWPCSDTLGRLRSLGGRVPSFRRQVDFCQFVR